MTKFVALDRKIHMSRSWRRPRDFRFAANESLVAVAGTELAMTAASMPLVFVKREETFELVALLSLEMGRNLFVAPDGQWAAGQYIPTLFRTYPFRLLRVKAAAQMVLCVDEDSVQNLEGSSEERFFDAGGQPTAILAEVIKTLEVFERGRLMTISAAKALDKAGVIVPWKLGAGDGVQNPLIDGVHRVDEPRLNALGDNEFMQLRKSGGLPVAYAQLMSMARLELLPRLAAYHSAQSAAPRNALAGMFGDGQDDTLRFG